MTNERDLPTCQQNAPSPNREARRYADELLATDGRRIALVSLLVILVGLWVGGYYATVAPGSALTFWALSAGQEILAAMISYLPLLLMLGMAFFVLAPLSCGLMRYVLLLSRADLENRPALREIFAPFTSGERYSRTLAYLWGDAWRAFLCLLIPGGTVVAAVAILVTLELPWSLTALVVFFAAAVTLAAFLVALRLLSPTYLTPALIWERPDLSVGQCRALSRQMTRDLGGQIFRQHLYFICMSLLSLLSVGIVLLLHVLPEWLLTYATRSRALIGPASLSEYTSEDV